MKSYNRTINPRRLALELFVFAVKTSFVAMHTEYKLHQLKRKYYCREFSENGHKII